MKKETNINIPEIKIEVIPESEITGIWEAYPEEQEEIDDILKELDLL